MLFCVTGGSSGLGYSLSQIIVSKKHSLIVIDKVSSDLPCTFIKHDFKYKFTKKIHCDILVLNHCYFDGFSKYSNLSPEYTQEYINANITANLDILLLFKYSKVVYISSVLSFVTFPNILLYSSIKSFMSSVINTLRLEGTSVLIVYPYKINTTLFNSVNSIYTINKDILALEIYNGILSNRTEIYSPWVFRYIVFVFSLLPLIVQDSIIKILYRLTVNKNGY
ncbi:hypothetical protein NEOKW01_0118 [Nematocida sp. AWRm80]|nr:hypothetical protein NEOKW01_0118 [Nematocida sp. AWRm80]